MLKSIHIANYALISSLDISFNAGFSVMTGETGAGKSIILGALSLILGQRADSKSIRTDADKSIVEAVFDISEYKYLTDFFEQHELDNDLHNCYIRRELTATGKSRAFINDTPVSLNILRDLTSQLIDIHSQHENLILSNPHFQLDVLDTVAQNAVLQAEYKSCYVAWGKAVLELAKIKEEAARAADEIDFIRFQFEQLSAAALQVDEQSLLEAEQEALVHVEEIKTELGKTTQLLDGEYAVLSTLKEIVNSFSKINHFLPEGNEKLERFKTAQIDLKDLAEELNNYLDNLSFDPGRLSFVEERLSEIYSLQKKHKVESVEGLINKRNEYDKQLQHISSFDEEIEKKEKLLAGLISQLDNSAEKLSQSRKAHLVVVDKFMVDQLTKLGMPNIRFRVELSRQKKYTESGIDQVQYLFSANKNRPLQTVESVASGGEISRLMLSLKSLMAGKSDLPTIIFDEIDNGVSGEIAHRMSEIMHEMSNSMQVITITHLPQIAAKGANHYRVFKDESGKQTETFIQKLNPAERIHEIAGMLSGQVRGEAAVQNARELLGLKD